jgi:hypothetical protein
MSRYIECIDDRDMAEDAAVALIPCTKRHVSTAMLGSDMPEPDLNLLIALDVLLADGSVAGAARRLD